MCLQCCWLVRLNSTRFQFLEFVGQTDESILKCNFSYSVVKITNRTWYQLFPDTPFRRQYSAVHHLWWRLKACILTEISKFYWQWHALNKYAKIRLTDDVILLLVFCISFLISKTCLSKRTNFAEQWIYFRTRGWSHTYTGMHSMEQMINHSLVKIKKVTMPDR